MEQVLERRERYAAPRRRAMRSCWPARAMYLAAAGIVLGTMRFVGLLPGLTGWAAGLRLGAGALPALVEEFCETAAVPAQEESVAAAAPLAEPQSVRLDVAPILQNPELPNGCEITSAAMVLQYLGFDADKTLLAECYLPRGDLYTADPEWEYMGEPWANGWFCYAGPVAEAINAYLADREAGEYHAVDLTGASLSTLKACLRAGEPVLVWVTVDLDEMRSIPGPGGELTYGNLHCVVLTGYGEGVFYLADPLGRLTEADSEWFEVVCSDMGCRAVVVQGG